MDTFGVANLDSEGLRAMGEQDLQIMIRELALSNNHEDPRFVDMGLAMSANRHVWSDAEGSPIRPCVRTNNLWYCQAHERDICQECNVDKVVNNNRAGFERPIHRIYEFPRLLIDKGDWQLVRRIYKRWLDIEMAVHPATERSLTIKNIRLPTAQLPDEVKDSTSALQGTLLQLFRQLRVMAAEQRYSNATQAKIMLEDYDTFAQAAVLYEEELADKFAEDERIWLAKDDFLDKYILASARTTDLEQIVAQYGMTLPKLRELLADGTLRPFEKESGSAQKATASIVNTLGFFLGLSSQRVFWRALELTADAFVLHLEKYNEDADGQAVLTDKAKACLLHCVGHVFWSLQYAQHRLDQMRAIQHMVYQRGFFPFYPFHGEALKAGADIHVVIARLCKAPMYDFPLVSSLLSAFEAASHYREQMQHVNSGIMAGYDELSTRFRVMQVILLAARLVAPEADIKAEFSTFKFETAGKEVTSKMDHVARTYSGTYETELVPSGKVTGPATLNEALMTSMCKRVPTPERLALEQSMLVKENSIRYMHTESFMRAPLLTYQPKGFTPEMFNAFKARFSQLYRESIRKQLKQEEKSLLQPDVASRYKHRKDVSKKKKRSQISQDKMDIAEDREVPETKNLDPSLFWEVGDGSLEKYIPPVVQEKVKTRKQQEPRGPTPGDEGSQSSGPSSPDHSDKSEGTPRSGERSLNQLKESDLITRDILWRKVKGTLKWSNLVQLLTRFGCWILNLDGSKRKVVDPHTGRCTVLHMPHPGDECRPDQRDSYRVHIEDWLQIKYAEVVPADEHATISADRVKQ